MTELLEVSDIDKKILETDYPRGGAIEVSARQNRSGRVRAGWTILFKSLPYIKDSLWLSLQEIRNLIFPNTYVPNAF